MSGARPAAITFRPPWLAARAVLRSAQHASKSRRAIRTVSDSCDRASPGPAPRRPRRRRASPPLRSRRQSRRTQRDVVSRGRHRTRDGRRVDQAARVKIGGAALPRRSPGAVSRAHVDGAAGVDLAAEGAGAVAQVEAGRRQALVLAAEDVRPPRRAAASEASARLPKTRISATPAASAAVIVVVARSTSKTTTERPSRWRGSRVPGEQRRREDHQRGRRFRRARCQRQSLQQRHRIHVHRHPVALRQPPFRAPPPAPAAAARPSAASITIWLRK